MNLEKFHELIDTGDVSKIEAYLVLKSDNRMVDLWAGGSESDLAAMLSEVCRSNKKLRLIIWLVAFRTLFEHARIPKGGEE